MKVLFKFILVGIIVSFIRISNANCQNTTITPSELKIPNLSVAPECNTTNKGSIFLLNTTNKIYYCDGAAWVEVNSNPSPSVIFNASLSSIGSNVTTLIPFTAVASQNVGNAFDNVSHAFIIPTDGWYHFDATACLNTSTATGMRISIFKDSQGISNTNTSSTFSTPSASCSVTKFFQAGNSITVNLIHNSTSTLNILPVCTSLNGYKV